MEDMKKIHEKAAFADVDTTRNKALSWAHVSEKFLTLIRWRWLPVRIADLLIAL
jgi:hypothetical protein